jgi:hypothetical protein
MSSGAVCSENSPEFAQERQISVSVRFFYSFRAANTGRAAETGQPLINQHLQEINQLHGQDGIVSSLRVKIGTQFLTDLSNVGFIAHKRAETAFKLPGQGQPLLVVPARYDSELAQVCH